MNKPRGFTLIELMIVVAIVAILAAIALPAYNNYVARSKLSEAYSKLSGLSLAMQQYYQDNRTYKDATSSASPDPWPCASTNLTAGQYFSYDCSPTGIGAPTTTTFSAEATATATDLGGGSTPLILRINQDGTKSTPQVPSGWTLPSTSCWVHDQSGGC
jgi:type IV pilus assembly protein PilE